ncbi:hypothetical protein GCM10010112_65680 [Actinoplanes lobatus]|uniref:Glycosyl hydrolase family 12 n=1 Tax=Actinoplanes lobatus TaxID=113568 RepID=A0A7W7HK03_9ACTN|nr:hypothetical protein [Actinoplanes lobatus]MBB4751956.1 hypothetical protein [Actinoplanes lobatus]GGN85361.1 hypothetical protein GCM10010112_65680 [Actinoplanes lobatus]GIE44317.1 hypothetical protein Alo02nite_72150 [Actinoplanes lobatus]
MIRSLRIAVASVVTLLVTAVSVQLATPAQAATWNSSAQWATWSNGGYTLYNNIWGSGAGTQVIWANSYSNWGVWAAHPATGGIKAYPNATKYLGKKVSALGTTTSSFNVTVPTSGAAFTSAYDIWSSDNAYEIMLWMNAYGAVGPLGTLQTTATVGGHTWRIYRGSNGSNAVFSFVRTSNTSSGTVDIRAIAQWLRSAGWWGDVTVGNVQFGYEITSSAGGKDFITNSFSVTG